MLVSFIGIIFHLNNYIQQLQNGQANNISTTTTKQICIFVLFCLIFNISKRVFI